MTGFVPLTAGRGWRPLAGADGGDSAATVAGDPVEARGPRVTAAEARADEEARREAERAADAEKRLAERIAALEARFAEETARREAEREAEHAAAMTALAAAEEARRGAVEASARAGARHDEAAARLDRAAEALLGARAAAVAEVRAHAAAVILEGARRIAGDALHADPALLDALVAAAVDALGRAGTTVRVAPEDAAALRGRWEGLEVVEDAGVVAGCVCVGPAGQVDASLGVAVAALRGVLDAWRA